MRTLFLAISVILVNTDTCVNSQKSENLKYLVEKALLSKGSPKRYWVADMDMSDFQKADSLTFVADKNYTFHSHQLNGRCQFICWEFLENNLVNGFEYHLCEEPPIARFLAKKNMSYQMLPDNKIKILLDNEILTYKLTRARKVTISETVKEVYQIELVKL